MSNITDNLDKFYDGAGIIVLNSKGEVLLHLRDDNPSIPWPNQWDLTGGGIEPGETPEEAIIREIDEEWGIELKTPNYWKQFKTPTHNIEMFWKVLDFEPANINLTEGQKIQWFPREEALRMKLAHTDSEILAEFFETVKI